MLLTNVSNQLIVQLKLKKKTKTFSGFANMIEQLTFQNSDHYLKSSTRGAIHIVFLFYSKV